MQFRMAFVNISLKNVGIKTWPKISQIAKKQNNEYTKSHANNNCIHLTPTNWEEILKIITDMKNKKSCGHDGINSILLREIKLSVCAPLTTTQIQT